MNTTVSRASIDTSYLTSSRIVTRGNSGPYGSPVSGLIVMGEADPYGEPNAFPQKIKNLEVSNALPWPINGPHLHGCQWQGHQGARGRGHTNPRHRHFQTM